MNVVKSIARLRAIVQSIETVISSLELMLESDRNHIPASRKRPAAATRRRRLTGAKTAGDRSKRGKY